MPRLRNSTGILLAALMFLISTTGCGQLADSIEAQVALDQGFDHAIDGDFDKALVEFERAIELDPELAAAYDARGTIWLEREELDGAMQDYNRAIELDPEMGLYYADRGLVYTRMGETDKAIGDYEKAIELSEEDPIAALAHLNLGEIYVFVGPEELAVEHLQEALQIGLDAQLESHATGLLEALGEAPQ
jgi:tetratricopeptide (TPR) repeat protein